MNKKMDVNPKGPSDLLRNDHHQCQAPGNTSTCKANKLDWHPQLQGRDGCNVLPTKRSASTHLRSKVLPTQARNTHKRNNDTLGVSMHEIFPPAISNL